MSSYFEDTTLDRARLPARRMLLAGSCARTWASRNARNSSRSHPTAVSNPATDETVYPESCPRLPAIPPKTVGNQHGFDENDGANGNGGPDNVTNPHPKQLYAMTERGLDFMARQVRGSKPCYLQLSHYASRRGGDASPQARATVQGWGGNLSEREIAEAAADLDLDIAFGQMLKKVDDLRIADNTYVIFTTDHGTPGKNPPLARDLAPTESLSAKPRQQRRCSWALEFGPLCPIQSRRRFGPPVASSLAHQCSYIGHFAEEFASSPPPTIDAGERFSSQSFSVP